MRNLQVKKKATYEDIINLPDNVVGEILNGELVVSPRPAPKHSVAYSSIGGIINSAFHRKSGGGPGGWWILDEPELHMDENVVVPDMGGWRKDRMPKIPETAYFEQAPDWVCEIISPQSGRYDRIVKAEIYARNHVPYYWLVDPQQKTLECMELSDGVWRINQTFSENDPVKAAPFDAITFELSDLWCD